MTQVSNDRHKPEILFLILTECQNVGLVCVTILEQFNLTAGVLISLTFWRQNYFLFNFSTPCI